MEMARAIIYALEANEDESGIMFGMEIPINETNELRFRVALAKFVVQLLNELGIRRR